MKAFLRMAALLTLAAFTVLSLQGCNTIRGVGKDVEKGGEKIQDVAQ